MKQVLVLFSIAILGFAHAQPMNGSGDWKKNYRATATKINDLLHTKLDASFDYSRSYLDGKVWISLKPHFYPTDSLQLDAKGMEIHKVALLKAGKPIALKFKYDGNFLKIPQHKSPKDQKTDLLSVTWGGSLLSGVFSD